MSGRRPAWKRVVDVRVELVELEREVEGIPRSSRPEVEEVRSQLIEHLAMAGTLANQLGELAAEGRPW